MNKIKIFAGWEVSSTADKAQEKIDKWLAENPTFNVEHTSISIHGDKWLLCVVYSTDTYDGVRLNS